MESALLANSSEHVSSRLAAWWPQLWPSDRISFTFFAFLAALALQRGIAATHTLILMSIAAALFAASSWESRNSKPWTRILREWLSLGVILLAYWCIEWFSTSAKIEQLQERWLGWDRILLDQYGLRAGIESLGSMIPFLLETAYLLLYTMPVAALIVLQRTGTRDDRRSFLATLFLGTFPVYALLPLIAVESPRRVFPHQDEPRILTAPRQLNTYLLDHLDISTGVFPSGHVAVAFSTAFGLLDFVRRQRRNPLLPAAAFVMGTLVFLATVYGRYHYAVDGLASICIAAAASFLIQIQTERIIPNEV